MIYKDAEAIIIGRVLFDETTDYEEFLEYIKPEYFTLRKYEKVYNVIKDLFDRGVEISPRSISLNIENVMTEYGDLLDIYSITLYREAIRVLKKGYYQKKIEKL